MAEGDVESRNNFMISINGQIESAIFPYFDDIYCKYSFVCGPDWVIISGIEEGISQISKKGRDEEQSFVWNLPLNIVYKSTNPHGWPQLVVSTYGLDVFGNEVVRGYGVCHVPISPGRFDKKIAMFVPESSSLIQKFTSWLTGRRPEFVDARILTQGDSREVVRVRSQGMVKIQLEVVMRGLQALGYRKCSVFISLAGVAMKGERAIGKELAPGICECRAFAVPENEPRREKRRQGRGGNYVKNTFKKEIRVHLPDYLENGTDASDPEGSNFPSVNWAPRNAYKKRTNDITKFLKDG